MTNNIIWSQQLLSLYQYYLNEIISLKVNEVKQDLEKHNTKRGHEAILDQEG